MLNWCIDLSEALLSWGSKLHGTTLSFKFAIYLFITDINEHYLYMQCYMHNVQSPTRDCDSPKEIITCKTMRNCHLDYIVMPT